MLLTAGGRARRVLVAVLVLVGLLVVADFAAAAAAESTVSRQMRDRLGLPEDPSVRVNGVSFLAQAATGRYRSVDVAMDRLPVGSLRTRQVKIELHDLRAPYSELSGSGPARFRVTSAESVVTIGAGDVMRMVPAASDLTMTQVDANAIDEIVLDGGDPTLRGLDPRNATLIEAKTVVGGVRQKVEVLAALQITGDGLIRITPRDVRSGDGADDLPAAAVTSLTTVFSLVVDPGRLPFRVTPTTLRVEDEDQGRLVLSGQVKDLVVGDGERSASAQGY